jgi:hypothetical protein
MKNILCLLLCLTQAVPAAACINDYHERPRAPRKPKPNPAAEFMAQLRDQENHDRIVQGPAPVDPGADADYRLRSDYASALIRRGDSPKAVEILESIERTNPGEYRVAANLGTAYELSGDLVKAHQWISEGIRRNPRSHDGTEWLHLRILEARQALAKDPKWLSTHSVTGLDFGKDAEPRKPERWPKDSGNAEGVIAALTYQLRERMAFVPAPDPLVGSLIADLAVMLLLFRSPDVAVPVFDLALTYRPLKPDQVTSRKSIAEEIIRSRKSSDTTLKLMLMGLAALALAGVVVLKWRPGRRATPAFPSPRGRGRR